MTPGPLGPVFEGPLYAHGFSLRKRRYLRGFADRRDVRFIQRASEVPAGVDLLLWGSTPLPEGLGPDVRTVRVEDGFVRSVGLGADLIRPLSWVFDDQGIYYDSNSASALERLLQNTQFAPADVTRASMLRQRLVEAGLTKYNLAARHWDRPAAAEHVVLVAGQVETDASIASGALDIRSNLALLKSVRKARPDAWVVYKPHPDVVAGLRGAGAGEGQVSQHCDEIVVDGRIHDMLLGVDEVHVMTSLTGFEALLRGKPVTCWGHPFYAGWGLTSDQQPHPRRSRRLSLDELVTGALLLYPVYLSPATGRRCTPEQAIEELLRWRHRQPETNRWWRRWLRPFISRA